MSLNVGAIVVLILFAIDSIIHLCSDFVDDETKKKIIYATKPLLMPLLLIFYLIATSIVNGVIIAGLIGGWLGDIFLLKKGSKKLFMLGLISFLLGHLLYIIAFLISISWFQNTPLWIFALIFPYLILLYIIFNLLKDHLGKMKIPTTIYMIIILVMSFAALAVLFTENLINVGNKSIVFLGSILFIISDFLLAWNKFKSSITHERIYVMSTYILAQFCIVFGFII
jgi:uncharacterized membrane protein YhhN